MPVHRTRCNMRFAKNTVPAWPCPSCSSGILSIKPDTFSFAETKRSRLAEGQEDWEPDSISYRFSALLECKNSLCREVVTVSGGGYRGYELAQSYDPETEEYESELVYEELFYVTHMYPSTPLVSIPTECPSDIIEELQKAFVSSWGDPYAALNHIRSSIEKLLDHFNVKKFSTNPSGKESTIPVHRRIESFLDYGENIVKSLLAVKYVGNAGSHSNKVIRNDVYDALDIIEVVLEDLFLRHREKIQNLVSKINEGKGPIRQS